MDTKQKFYIGIAALIGLLLIFMRKRSVVIPTAPTQNQFDAPFTQWPNGIYPGPQNMNGTASPFGDINVNVTLPNAISNDYIPMFGFTGVVAVG